MEIIQVRPSGYCKGVINAISKVKKARQDYPNQKIYILGMLIHNRYVVDALTNLGVVTIEDPNKTKYEIIDSLDDGIIVFTAHGIDPKIKQYAIDQGFTVIDATCDDVTKNLQLCQQYLSKGYDIIYIGKKNHPESAATVCLSNRIHLITDEIDLLNLSIKNDKILLTNQTTMSILDIEHLIQLAIVLYPSIKVAQEICSATRSRQNAVKQLKNVDCLIVVGDPISNNTTQLANIARLSQIRRVIKVQTAQDLQSEHFAENEIIAVTSGASTPAYLTQQVIRYLKSFDTSCFDIDIEKVLD